MNKIMRCLAILFAVAVFYGSARGDEPKQYRITLDRVAKIGATEFQPGEYKLLVDAPKVRFTELKSGKEVEIEAKVEAEESKFEHTMIHSRMGDDGIRKISEIRIGGSKTKIVFD